MNPKKEIYLPVLITLAVQFSIKTPETTNFISVTFVDPG